MEHDFIYEPRDETFEKIEWDWLDSSYTDDLGNCYKTLEEIPAQYRHLVRDKHMIDVPQNYITNMLLNNTNDTRTNKIHSAPN